VMQDQQWTFAVSCGLAVFTMKELIMHQMNFWRVISCVVHVDVEIIRSNV
jgi:hypothetical protein